MPKPSIQSEITRLGVLIASLRSKAREGYFNEATQEYERFDSDQHDFIQKALKDLEQAKQFLLAAQNG